MRATGLLRTTSRTGLALGVSALLGATLVAPAAADDGPIDCTEVGIYDPDFGNWFVEPQVLDGDVVVPNLSPDTGAFCVFANPVITGDLIVEAETPDQDGFGPAALIFGGAEGGLIEGNVRVGSGSFLANYGATVGGNVLCHGCDRVELAGGVDFDGNPFTTQVDGNVLIWRASFGALIDQAVVGGSVVVRRSTASFDPANGVFDDIAILQSTIEGNVRISRNTGNAESITVSDNTIDGYLACWRNDPRPLVAGNAVDRRSWGQCR